MIEPLERLPACNKDVWEENVQCIVEEFLEPAGFELKTVSRVPYLSKGDTAQSYYQLDEALLVLQAVNDDAHCLVDRAACKGTSQSTVCV